MTNKTFQTTLAGYQIKATVTVIGKDLLIALTGGDTPHIGTVTYGYGDLYDTKRFPSHHGRYHKDDVLSELFLKQIQPLLLGTCVLTAGIHVNGITKEQIEASFVMTEKLGIEVATWLKNYDFSGNDPLYENYHQTYQE